MRVIQDEINPNQANDEYPLQLWEIIREKLWAASKAIYLFTTDL